MISKKYILVILIMMGLIGGLAYALKIFGEIGISYEVAPAAEAPTLEPNPIELSLGTIPSGSTGSKDFGKVGSLTLPAGYEITFELNATTAEDFEELTIYIRFYMDGDYIGYIALTPVFPRESITLDEGTYELRVEIEYTAKSVTSKRAGTIIIYVMWPG